jgi:hypothetical protein
MGVLAGRCSSEDRKNLQSHILSEELPLAVSQAVPPFSEGPGDDPDGHFPNR